MTNLLFNKTFATSMRATILPITLLLTLISAPSFAWLGCNAYFATQKDKTYLPLDYYIGCLNACQACDRSCSVGCSNAGDSYWSDICHRNLDNCIANVNASYPPDALKVKSPNKVSNH